MRNWFTSDYHYNHENIIKYANRPFKTVEEMNETITRKHNERVRDEDTVFDLGDFNFKNSSGGKQGEGLPVKPVEYLKQLKGYRVRVKGNHTRQNGDNTPIEKVYIRYGGKRICLVHNPTHADPGCELNLVGHVHTAWKIKRMNEKSIMVNVGVDMWNFFPITYEEINKEVAKFLKHEKGKGAA